jgi:DNA invertase Pin-like site-specific DNA recombinase
MSKHDNPNNGKPYVPYGRISKLNGRTKGDNVSIVEQQKAVERIASSHGLELLPEMVSDEDVSGMTFDRPGWQKAVGLVKSGKAAGIVAFDMKRISRGKTAEVLLMVEEIEDAGGSLYDSTGLVSMKDADAELITTLKAMINRRDTQEKRAYLLTSVENAIGRGVHLSAPYGYRKPPRRNNRSQPLQVVEAEAAQVKRAFELRASGATWTAIAAALNTDGAKPRPHRRDGVVLQAVWQHKTVKQLVHNEVYLGTAHNGSHRLPGAHKAIVTPELFAAANKAKGTKALGPKDGYLLTGLVRCSGCGYAASYAQERKGLYVRCRSAQHGAGRCPNPASVPARQLEAYVADRFIDEYLGDEVSEAHATDENVAEAAAKVDICETRLANAVKIKIGFGDDASQAELRIADGEIDQARAALRTAEQELLAAKLAARGAEFSAEEVNADVFRKALADDVPEARHLLSRVYRAVIVSKAASWRQPAAERSRIVHVDEAPVDQTALIGWVAAQPD